MFTEVLFGQTHINAYTHTCAQTEVCVHSPGYVGCDFWKDETFYLFIRNVNFGFSPLMSHLGDVITMFITFSTTDKTYAPRQAYTHTYIHMDRQID